MANILTRRSFLERSVQLALGAAASAYFGIPGFLKQAMAQGQIPDGTKKVLFIFLRGGNDGINTIIPWGDDAYNATTRPTLYLPKPDLQSVVSGKAPTQPDLTKTIDLGNSFAGIHPGLRDSIPLYNDGQLAFIHRVGYPKQSRSHFDSQKYWENGVPQDNLIGSGIFYRAIVNTGLHVGRQFPAVSVQGSAPLLLRGSISMPNLSSPSRYDMAGTGNGDRNKLKNFIDSEFRIPYPDKTHRGMLFGTGQTLKSSIDSIKSIGLDQNDLFDRDGVTHLFPIDDESNQIGVSSSSYGFFGDLKVAAQLLANTDAVIAGTRLDGFDTHDNQGALTGAHANRMRWLGWAMYALRHYFTSVNPKLWENTVVITLSEFGRTSKENGSQGTDHAEASAMFVAGGKVRGGVYQCGGDSWPTGPTGAMFQVSGRYLRRSVDYRSVLGEIIRDHVGATPAQLQTIIPGYAHSGERLQSGGRVDLDGVSITGELGII